jgi:hypothetical protein
VTPEFPVPWTDNGRLGLILHHVLQNVVREKQDALDYVTILYHFLEEKIAWVLL